MIYLIIASLIIGGIAYLFVNSKKTKNNELENNLTANTQPKTELGRSLNDSLTYSEKLKKPESIIHSQNGERIFLNMEWNSIQKKIAIKQKEYLTI